MEKIGKVYKIINNKTPDIYIGSSFSCLNKRFSIHKCYCSTSSLPLYKLMKEHGPENFKIEQIDELKCNSKDELRRLEGKYIKDLKPSLNQRIAGRVRREYYEDNNEYLKEYQKDYYNKNKERLTEIIKCECGGKYNIINKHQHYKTKRHIKKMLETQINTV